MKKSDLDSPTAIGEFVTTFYGRVAEDPLLGPIFNDQAEVQWDEHIPKLTAFWCKLVLGMPGFHGAPTQKHSALSSQRPFERRHFARWIELFEGTLREGWSGRVADEMLARAIQIAEVQSSVVTGAERWQRSEV